jgi:hypothetical protein
VRVDHDRLHVDLAALLARYGAAEVLPHVTVLEMTTARGKVIVSGRLALTRAQS